MRQHIKISKYEPNKGVLDYSYLLDAPAGKHGFVQIKNGHFYFEDGTRIRFIGFNIPTRSNTPDHETAEKMAERFASMGVNVIRLHAADAPIGESGWSSCKDSPLIDYNSGTSRKLNREGLDRFDFLIAKLKEKGIYLHVDLLVTRFFQDGDGLDYPNAPQFAMKCFSHINERLIELQKEYATELLTHVNPYTGLALIDEPAVMTIQIANEDSAFKGNEFLDCEESVPYHEELQRKFNHFLCTKYGTREKLKKAWTYRGDCALGEDECPDKGTVRIVEGDFLQVKNDPMGEWKTQNSPARYADYMEFGMLQNRRYYQEMIDHIRSLGAKAPIATSNLFGGPADVVSHMDGDVMENNAYFNHPIFPIMDNNYKAVLREYVSTDPLTLQKGEHIERSAYPMHVYFVRTTFLMQACTSVLEDKPFVMSEWNEYGLYPFHSTSFVSTAAYACLNDWDGLILYCHHTSERYDNQPDDEIRDIFDAYNDPSLICLFGMMAKIFLKGLVDTAKNKIDIVYTRNDLRTLPPASGMPYAYFPYISRTRNVFLENSDTYAGDADAAVTAGFVNAGDLSRADHEIYYTWSPYRDAWRHSSGGGRMERLAENIPETEPGIKCSEKRLLFEDIRSLSGEGDYRAFAKQVDKALKKWGLVETDRGLSNGAMVSDTGQIKFDPQNSVFALNTEYCVFFSGKPEQKIPLTPEIDIEIKNKRISVAVLPVDRDSIKNASRYLLTMLGDTGMDNTSYTKEGKFTNVKLNGKLYADMAEGILYVRCKTGTLSVLDTTGDSLGEIKGVHDEKGGMTFILNGRTAGVHYVLNIER